MRLVSHLRHAVTPGLRLATWALGLLVVALAAPSASGGAPAARTADPAGPPLVTLVTAGWHRGDHLGLAFQGVDVVTPTLDALARGGTLFEDASTSSNVTEPALAALLTGRDARSLDLRSQGQALVDEAHTLAEAFADAGWSTLAVLGSRPPAAAGLTQGFARVSSPEAFARPASEVVSQALAWLDESDGPTFLWVHLDDAGWPHEPSDASLHLHVNPDDDPRFVGLRTGKVIKVSLPPSWRDVTDLPWMRAMYRAEIQDLDGALAPLFAHPRVASHWRAYVGAQGLSLGEHLIWMKAEGLYPGVLQVPLLVAGPGVEAGRRSAAPVRTQDLGRTLLDLAGVAGPDVPGVDLFAVDAGREPAPLRFALEDHGLAASVNDGTLQVNLTLQNRRSKHMILKRKTHQIECYALADDPRAEDDLFAGDDETPIRADEHLDRIQVLLGHLRDWLASEPEPSLRRDVDVDPGQVERRAGQGYLPPEPVEPRRLWRPDGCLVCQWLGG